MPIPPNTTPGTATVILALPYTDAQQVDDSGTTYPVWYKWIADFTGVIGAWGFGDLVVYKPNTFIGSPDEFTTYLDFLLFGPNTNKPLCFPVTLGETYYFAYLPPSNVSPANFSLSVLTAPTDLYEIGDLYITGDDATEQAFWATILCGDVDNTVRRFDNSNSPGEQGQILESGKFLLSDDGTFGPFKTNFYNADLSLASSLTWPDLVHLGLSKVLQQFYIAYPNPANFTLAEMDSSGTLTGTTWATTITTVGAITVNSDASILYYSRGGISDIKRWDLIGNAPLSDLVATTANYAITDLIYLEDDTILACFLKASPVDVLVKRFSTAGALLNTYSFGSDSQASGAPPRINTALDSPDSFWIWIKRAAARQTSTFYNIRVSDGATLTTRTHVIYEVGVYSGVATVAPESRFGSSHSCTFLVLRAAESPPPPTPGSILVQKVTSPGGLPDLFDFTAGGGLSPGSFQLADGGSQLYDPVAVGSGYSIVETPAAGFSTLVSVSNGSPNTNISVGSAEAVVVTVTNAQQVAPGGGDGCPLGAPDAVTGEDGCTIPNDF